MWVGQVLSLHGASATVLNSKQGTLNDLNNNNIEEFADEQGQENLLNMNVPEFDREYFFAVITYLFPGLLSRLIRAALNRHRHLQEGVNNQLAGGNFNENVLGVNLNLAPIHNNKALRHLQRAFGLVNAPDPADLDLEVHRRDGNIRVNNAYLARTMISAYNGKFPIIRMYQKNACRPKFPHGS